MSNHNKDAFLFNWRITAAAYSSWFDGYNRSKLTSPPFGPQDRSFSLKLQLEFDKKQEKDLIFVEWFNHTRNLGSGGDNENKSPIHLNYKIFTSSQSRFSESPIKIYYGKRVLIWSADSIFPDSDQNIDKNIRAEFTIARRDNPQLQAMASPFIPSNHRYHHKDLDKKRVKLDTTDWSAPYDANDEIESKIENETVEIVASPEAADSPVPVSYSNATISTHGSVSNISETNEEVHSVVENTSSDVSIFESSNSQLKQLASDFAALRDNKKLSDATLVVGKNEFAVHKSILAARSPVFAELFNGKENYINIEGVDSEVVDVLLDFIYSGDVTSVQQYATELWTLAFKFGIEPLMKACEKYKFDKFTVDTAATILSVANQQGLEDLKLNVIAFINTNAEKVMATKEWKELIRPNAALMAELYENMIFMKASN